MESARSVLIAHPAVITAPVVADFKISPRVHWKKLAVHMQQEIRFVPFGDITYCSAQQNYTRIFTSDGKVYVCSKTLKEIEKKLPEDRFIRIHHSHLVNINCITALKKGEGTMEINHAIELPISKNMKKYLLELLCGG